MNATDGPYPTGFDAVAVPSVSLAQSLTSRSSLGADEVGPTWLCSAPDANSAVQHMRTVQCSTCKQCSAVPADSAVRHMQTVQCGTCKQCSAAHANSAVQQRQTVWCSSGQCTADFKQPQPSRSHDEEDQRDPPFALAPLQQYTPPPPVGILGRNGQRWGAVGSRGIGEIPGGFAARNRVGPVAEVPHAKV
jgi:hypothetical protein